MISFNQPQMKILITGANGYLGKHVVKFALQDTNAEIIAVDFKAGDIQHNRLTYLEMDLLGQASTDDLYGKLGRPDICIHLAWQDGFKHQASSHINNLPVHFNFLKNMVDSGCSSISVMGTMHEIGYFEGAIDENTPCNPLSLYGVAKNALRQTLFLYTKDKEVSVKWLRAFYITGDDAKNQSIFGKILQMVDDGKTSFPFTSGKNKYDFIDIDELAKQIVRASCQMDVCGIINCCSGKPVALKDKVIEFISQHHLNITPEYGAFPDRPYDSPAVWGDASLIQKIMKDNKSA